MKIYAFDFDGTLTSCDTFLLFGAFVRGRWRLAVALLRCSPLLLLMKMGLYDNGRAKERVFSLLFRGMREDAFERACRDFAARRRDIIRPRAERLIHGLLAAGDCRVVVVSASIDRWVRPFFPPQVLVTGTEVEVADGRLTGRFATPNCYGAEKVRRLSTLLPERDTYHLTAYGDSRGDKQLLDYADTAYYRALE